LGISGQNRNSRERMMERLGRNSCNCKQ